MGKSAYDFLADTRTGVEEILAKMLFIKKEGKNRVELRELITQASVAFLSLRQINRIILQEEDRTKQETEAAKLPVDHTTLQLNNLLYEKNHYLKAINACKDFKSKYPDIELVPEENFFRDAPQEFKDDPSLKDDPHKRMLERLNFELYQRKELCKQRELLEARKKILQENIANRRKFLSSLPSHLKALKKASLPVQQQLGILHTKRMKQHHLAELLPAPLYILYSQILSQKEAFDESIDLEILGSAKDAQAVARQQALKDSGTNFVSHEESKADEDPQEEDDDSQRRRKRAKKSQIKETADDGIYQAHPLSVLWHIYDEDQGEDEKPAKLLTVRFEYLMKLNVVCAGTEGAHDGPLELLTNLFPDDTGLDLPTQVGKLSAGLEFQYDPNRSLRPYKWVQHLAGIDFLPECPPSLLDGPPKDAVHSKGASLSNGLAAYRQQRRVQTILGKLCSRRKAHLDLKDQLETLSNLKLPTLKFIKVPWRSHNTKCYLQSWAEVMPSASIDRASGLSHVVFPVDGISVSPRDCLESAREDGELPLAGFGSAFPRVRSNYVDATERKGFSVKEKSYRDQVSAALPKSSFLGLGISRSTSFNGMGDPDLADGLHEDMISETDVLAEDNIDNVGMAMPPYNFEPVACHKRIPVWEHCGTRDFHAVFRRDDIPGGKTFDLEAEVKVSSEYPVRPPHFTLRLASQGLILNLPAPPNGVLDISETPRTTSASMNNFNELRAIEMEVNIRVLDALPQSHENDILAHQFSLLAMLFDIHIDHQVSVDHRNFPMQMGDKDIGSVEVIGGVTAPRVIRGRDRQTVVL